ncbi:MAG: hypothetical protein M3460_00915 [Actinomycetota bacterium]|nr:hypothetical protein [Actinomycetota bacterium]
MRTSDGTIWRVPVGDNEPVKEKACESPEWGTLGRHVFLNAGAPCFLDDPLMIDFTDHEMREFASEHCHDRLPTAADLVANLACREADWTVSLSLS